MAAAAWVRRPALVAGISARRAGAPSGSLTAQVPADDSGPMTASPLFLDLGLPDSFRMVISTRRGGVSPRPWDSQNHGTSTGDTAGRVSANRELLLAALPEAPQGWASARQVHGTEVLRAGGPGAMGEADALCTDRHGLALAIRVADCSAVALAHPPSGRFGLAHAGWRGAAGGVISALLGAMEVPASETWAAVSPHLRGCCFEVGPDVVEAFGGRFTEPRQGDRSSLHLDQAIRSELLGLGIEPDRIREAGICTSCVRDDYFSHRRDRGATGRMVALAWRA